MMCLAKLRHEQGYRLINFVSEGCCVACMLCCTYSCFVYMCVSIVQFLWSPVLLSSSMEEQLCQILEVELKINQSINQSINHHVYIGDLVQIRLSSLLLCLFILKIL